MISKLSMNSFSPSFGLAKLNNKGAQAISELGYRRNGYLNTDMFEKQGVFKKAAISGELASSGKKIMEVCEEYGCSNNAKSNAEFIVNQILSKKGRSILKQYPKDEVVAALAKLYDFNYDNPELSKKATLQLLEAIADAMPAADYLQNKAILSEGSH